MQRWLNIARALKAEENPGFLSWGTSSITTGRSDRRVGTRRSITDVMRTCGGRGYLKTTVTAWQIWDLLIVNAVCTCMDPRTFSTQGFLLPSKHERRFYRAMHFSAKRGIAIACRLFVCPSVCPSVCDVGGLWSHRLEFFENNFTVS